MRCIRRCSRCVGPSDVESGPKLCDDPLDDCLNPLESPYLFANTGGPIQTTHQIKCPNCGYVAPHEALEFDSPAMCVICGFRMLIRRVKQ